MGMDFVVKVAITLIVIFIFFVYYFRNFVFSRSIVWQSKSFFFGVLSSVAVIGIQYLIPDSNNRFFTAFVHAALVEEIVRFAVIAARIRYSSKGFSITEGIFDGVLIGLGFAFAENLHFAFNRPGFGILLRNVSAVPMHLIASGIMGFFLSYRFLSRHSRGAGPLLYSRRGNMAILALFVPVMYHGIYDLLLLFGKFWNYFLPLLIIAGFAYLQYLIVRGRVIFSRNLLNALGVDADELEIILQQKEYEKWINDFTVWEGKKVSIFVKGWNLFNLLAGIGLILLGSILIYVDANFPSLMIRDASIAREVKFSLLFLLPVTIGIIFILAEKVNFLFFREFMTHLPVGSIAEIYEENGEQSDAVVMDIFAVGAFLTARYDLDSGSRVRVCLHGAGGSQVDIQGEVIWSNHTNTAMPVGALFRYKKFGIKFLFFRLKHSFSRIQRRLMFTRGEM